MHGTPVISIDTHGFIHGHSEGFIYGYPLDAIIEDIH